MSSVDEFFAEIDQAIRDTPRVVRAWWAFQRWLGAWPRRWRVFREFFIRGRRGWAPSDTWSLDHYLAGVMGESLRYLADNEHGWPGEENGWKTMEDWQAELRKQADVLIAYSTEETYGDGPDAGAAIKRLADYWGHLWD